MNDTKIDDRLHDIEDEVRLLSGYISDAVGASLDTRIGGLAKSIESLKGFSVDVQNLSGQAQPDIEAYSSLHEELKTLNETIEAQFADIGERIGAMQPMSPDIKDITGKIPSYSKEFESLRNELKKISDTIGSRLVALEKQIEPMQQNDPEIKKLADQFPKHMEKLLSLQSGLESLQGGLKTLNAAVEQSQNSIGDSVDGGLTRISDDITPRFDAIAGEIKSLNAVVEQSRKSIGDSVDGSLTRLSEDIAPRFDALAGELKTLGDALPVIHDQVQSNNASQSQLQKEITESIGRLKKQFDAVTADFTSNIDSLNKNLSRNGDTIQNMSQRIGQKQDETAAKLLKEVTSLRENSEVIRRMCSTDEEKFLGTMTTVVYNRTTEMSGELTKIINSMKKWFASLDENQRRAAEKTMDRQDDMKKSLQFDINKVSETLQKVDMQVSHDKRRPIGAEIIRTSDKVTALEEIMPGIQEKVASIDEQLAQVSKEVRLMRWYVIAAAGVSIAVLAASFFI